MRTRKEIVEEAKRMTGQEGINLTSKLILETLLDIRDLLQNQENRENQSLQAKIITQCVGGTSNKHIN